MWASDNGALKQHGVTDKGRSLFAKLLSAAAIAAAAYNAKQAYDIAKKEKGMAQKYLDISKVWLDYYKEFAVVEDEELAEAMALTDVEPEYEVARGRARAVAWAAFKGQLDKATRCLSRYCTGLRQQMLMELTAAQAEAVALADGLGYRNERAYVENRSDVRFDRQLNVAKRGRNILPDTTSFAKASAGIYGDLWNQAWRGLNSAGAYLGWYGTRNDTAYPNTMLAGESAEEVLLNIRAANNRLGYNADPGEQPQSFYDSMGI